MPADEVIAWLQMKHGLRVACPEHLLILKLVAYEDRAGSPKGIKDEDDLVCILFAGETWREECLIWLTGEMLERLITIVGGMHRSACCTAICTTQRSFGIKSG